nr:zinc finger, CCHC-type [Tanacetum cinerariifolium]
YEKMIKFVEQPTRPAPALDPETTDPDTIDKYYENVNLEQEVACLMMSRGSLILNSLNKDYDQFVQNYNMHSMGKTIAELHAMLKLHEKGNLKKAKTLTVLAIRESYGTYICSTLQGLRERRKLKLGALSLYMGNGMCAVVEAIGCFDLILPSGLVIVLDNYHFAPSVTRGVVLISCLVNNSYIYTFTKYGIFVLKDNVFYFNEIPKDGIYEIDMRYPKKMIGYYFYYPLENKILVARNAKFFENSLMVQEASGINGILKSSESDGGLELIQEQDTKTSKNTSEIHNEVAPIGDLNEPPEYKDALSDLEFDKWL